MSNHNQPCCAHLRVHHSLIIMDHYIKDCWKCRDCGLEFTPGSKPQSPTTVDLWVAKNDIGDVYIKRGHLIFKAWAKSLSLSAGECRKITVSWKG